MRLPDRLKAALHSLFPRDEPTLVTPAHARCAACTPDAGGSPIYCRACGEWYCRISCFSLHKEPADATA